MNHTVVVDLGYGDSGKGTIVDYLCASRDARIVVRFHGGAQAAHRVVTPDGREHVFSQFGSGTLTGASTHLAAPMMVKPRNMLREADALQELGIANPLGGVTVERMCPVTTELHAAANRWREEARGDARHGSCGVGVGETARVMTEYPDLAIYAEDCLNKTVLLEKLIALEQRLEEDLDVEELSGVPHFIDLVNEYNLWARSVQIVDREWIWRALRRERVVFEGAQGVLLDEWFGFHPFTTWSTTTFEHADRICFDAGVDAHHLGVLRAYTTRHGPGPFPTEDAGLTEALPDPENGTNKWQGQFRVGHLDFVALRYATSVCGRLDGLAVTHLDRVAGPGANHNIQAVFSYRDGGLNLHSISQAAPGDFEGREANSRWLMRVEPNLSGLSPSPELISTTLGVPMELESWGPTRADKAQSRSSKPSLSSER